MASSRNTSVGSTSPPRSWTNRAAFAIWSAHDVALCRSVEKDQTRDGLGAERLERPGSAQRAREVDVDLRKEHRLGLQVARPRDPLVGELVAGLWASLVEPGCGLVCGPPRASGSCQWMEARGRAAPHVFVPPQRRQMAHTSP